MAAVALRLAERVPITGMATETTLVVAAPQRPVGLLLSTDFVAGKAAAVPRYAPLPTVVAPSPVPEGAASYRPGQLLRAFAALPADGTSGEESESEETTGSSSTDDEVPNAAPRRKAVPPPLGSSDSAEDLPSMSTATSSTTAGSVSLFGREPDLGSPELPSAGSRAHAQLRCKPCAFVFKNGCANGTECRFCHLCEPGEKKRRKKISKATRKAERTW